MTFLKGSFLETTDRNSFFQLGFTSWKAEQQLQTMGLLEKEVQKD